MSALYTSAQSTHLGRQPTRTKETLIHRIARWHTNYRTRRQLASLPDGMLKDIGISRIDAEQEANKAFWKD